MHKKAQSEVWQITLLFEFISGILIAGIFFYLVMSISEGSLITKEYDLKDYNLLFETVNSVPGDVDIRHSTGSFKFNGRTFESTGTVMKSEDFSIHIPKEGKDV